MVILSDWNEKCSGDLALAEKRIVEIKWDGWQLIFLIWFGRMSRQFRFPCIALLVSDMVFTASSQSCYALGYPLSVFPQRSFQPELRILHAAISRGLWYRKRNQWLGIHQWPRPLHDCCLTRESHVRYRESFAVLFLILHSLDVYADIFSWSGTNWR